MQAKLFSAAILFICCATNGRAQNETQTFKFNPAPFDKKTPLHQQLLKVLPYTNLQNKNKIDTSRPNYSTNLGDVYIDPQDGLPILKPYPQSTYHERTSILNPYLPPTSSKQSYVYPMPNPLNKALIVE